MDIDAIAICMHDFAVAANVMKQGQPHELQEEVDSTINGLAS
jgi:hypothetical protein